MAKVYDCAIIGGGVAGLALAILLGRANKSVILLEKEGYPFHKVCGEYISNESVPFLNSLGLQLQGQQLPEITKLFLSSPSGIAIKRKLDIGGIGLSRYELDNQLYQLALEAGAEVLTRTKARQVRFQDGLFLVDTGNQTFLAKTAAGAYGKNSIIDVQLGRKYKVAKQEDLFIAVKHHIRADFDPSAVEMHNFPGGYCGLSALEDNKVNMSYISRAASLKRHGSIAGLERNVLATNPYLRKYLDSAEFLFDRPLTISHLYFGMKQPVSNQMLMLGDAAGNIAPLSGNGMSMAFLSSKLASQAILSYLDNGISLASMGERYTRAYSSSFSSRISLARQINFLFGNPLMTDLGFRCLKVFPFLVDVMGKRIHGKTF